MNNPYGPLGGPYGPQGGPGALPASGYGYGGGGQGGGPRNSNDTMAWIGVVMSSISWISCCCTPVPFVGLLFALGGMLFAIAGLVCGVIAYREGKRTGTRTDIALVGAILGGTRLGLTVGSVVLVGLLLALGVGGAILEGIANGSHH